MLLTAKELKKYKFYTTDRKKYLLDDIYLDNKSQKIHFLVCNSRKYFNSIQALVEPNMIKSINKDQHRINLNITREQLEAYKNDIKNINQVNKTESGKKTSNFWSKLFMLYKPVTQAEIEDEGSLEEFKLNLNLHSFNEIMNYFISGKDGDIGWLEDLIIDTEKWHCKFLMFTTHYSLYSNSRIMPTTWVENIDWEFYSIVVNKEIKDIDEMPFYESLILTSKNYEEGVLDYFEQKEGRASKRDAFQEVKKSS